MSSLLLTPLLPSSPSSSPGPAFPCLPPFLGCAVWIILSLWHFPLLPLAPFLYHILGSFYTNLLFFHPHISPLISHVSAVRLISLHLSTRSVPSGSATKLCPLSITLSFYQPLNHHISLSLSLITTPSLPLSLSSLHLFLFLSPSPSLSQLVIMLE